MPAQIKIHKTPEGYFFELIAINGDSILKSVTFSSVSRCKIEIEEFREYSVYSHHIDKIADSRGQFSFLVRSRNDDAVASSMIFWSAASRDYAIQIVRRECKEAIVVMNGL